MRKCLLFGFFFLSVFCLPNLGAGETAAAPGASPACPQFSDEDTMRVYNSVTVSKINSAMVHLAVMLPYPESNAYQEVLGHVYGSAYGDGGKVRTTYDQRKYLRFLFTRNQMRTTDSVTVHDTFDIIYKEISVDFSKVDTSAQYDTLSSAYLKNIDGDGLYIHPTHPYVDSVARMIWDASSKSVLDYAYRCYQYVAEHLTYHLYYEGLLLLDTVIARQGGECGDFTTLLVNLLRNRRIPARHVAAFTADGQYHVWCEFLLPGYGWVPVDATYKNGNPGGNYFGEYHEHYIVSHQGIHLDMAIWDNQHVDCLLLQSFAWWYNYNGECNAEACRSVSGEKAQGSLVPISIAERTDSEPFAFQVRGRRLYYETQGNRRVSVYDVTGRLVGRAFGESACITLPGSGLYFVKPEGCAARKVAAY